MSSSWIAYNELAWTEDLLANPAEYEDEVAELVKMIEGHAAKPPKTLLHLGCGAGGYDSVLKRHFAVTGIDISRGMLDKARLSHPELEYVEGDMRDLRLQRQFDAVVIPDGIDYMATLADLRKAVETAVVHLNPGGVLLIVAKTQEIFKENNFAYTGEEGGLHVTLLENNYLCRHRTDSYEATLVYLVRRRDELTIHSERHRLGLFSQSTWRQIFDDAGLQFQEADLLGTYEEYFLNEGEYPLKIFIGTFKNS